MQQQRFNLLLGLLLLFQVPLALALRIPKGQTFASYGHTRFLANTLWQPCLPLSFQVVVLVFLANTLWQPCLPLSFQVVVLVLLLPRHLLFLCADSSCCMSIALF